MSSDGSSSQITLELIEAIAKQVREDLERDAIRTIRQKDTERGKACLDKIEGVDQFMEALRMACNSSFYRQRGMISQETAPVIRSHSLPSDKKARKTRKGNSGPR